MATCMRGSIPPYPIDMVLHAIPPIPCVPGPEPPPPGVRYLRPCPRYHLPDGSDGWCNRYNACLTCVSAEMNKRCVISPRDVSDTSPRYGTRYLLRPDACGCVALHPTAASHLYTTTRSITPVCISRMIHSVSYSSHSRRGIALADV